MGLNFDARWAYLGGFITCPTCVLIQISLVVESGDIIFSILHIFEMLFCDCPYVTKPEM